MVELTQQVLARHLYEKLPENHRRWYAGSMAFSLPRGGISQVSRMLGVSRKTISKEQRKSPVPVKQAQTMLLIYESAGREVVGKTCLFSNPRLEPLLMQR